MALSLIGVPELDQEVLLELDYNDLINACLSNRYLYNICQKESFWNVKIRHDFGNKVFELRPAQQSSQQIYKYLYDATAKLSSDELIQAASNNRADVVMALLDRGVESDVQIANWAASNNYINILELLEKQGVLPDVNGANYALAKGYTQVATWLEEKDITHDQRMINYLAGLAPAEVLETALQENQPTQMAANYALMNNRADNLQILKTKQIEPSEIGSELAVRANFIEQNAS